VPPSASLASSAVGICTGNTARLQVDLTGTPPWTVVWTDGFTQAGIGSTPASRFVAASGAKTYSLSSVTDGFGCAGTASGSTTVTAVALAALVRV